MSIKELIHRHHTLRMHSQVLPSARIGSHARLSHFILMWFQLAKYPGSRSQILRD